MNAIERVGDEFRTAIAAVQPDLADRPHRLLAAGWDSIAVEVDGRLVFKFPRTAAAGEALEREARLLAIVRSGVILAVPDMQAFSEPRVFSRHRKIPGEQLLTERYEALGTRARQRLAANLALFYAQLHALEPLALRIAGAGPIRPWLSPEDILRRAWPALPENLRPLAQGILQAWADLPPDPHGERFGHFDGHGWNMAFDPTRQHLNGIYDFGDAGFGPLHQEFVYGNWVARDLTARTLEAYERISGRRLDRRRIDVLSGVLRLVELAEHAEHPDHRSTMLGNVVAWIQSGA